MNKVSFTFLTALLFTCGSSIFISCGEQSHEGKDNNREQQDGKLHDDDGSDEHMAHIYQCPMQCEGDKTYEKPGKCPECKMDLEEIQKVDEHEHHDHDGHDHAH